MPAAQARKEIGERLRSARLSAKLTQEDVARDFLRSRQAVSAWEVGKTLPTLLEFKELAALYGVSSDRILYGCDDLEGECVRLLARVRVAAPPQDFEPSELGDLP